MAIKLAARYRKFESNNFYVFLFSYFIGQILPRTILTTEYVVKNVMVFKAASPSCVRDQCFSFFIVKSQPPLFTSVNAGLLAGICWKKSVRKYCSKLYSPWVVCRSSSNWCLHAETNFKESSLAVILGSRGALSKLN